MTIKSRGNGYQVAVHYAHALPGFQRMRKDFVQLADAEAWEAEVKAAIYKFGCWPVPTGTRELDLQKIKGVKIEEAKRYSGTLEEAFAVALNTHWINTRYYRCASGYANDVMKFMRDKCGRKDLDAITSADLDALAKYMQAKGNSTTTVNKKLNVLGKVMMIARDRSPPLMRKTIKISYLQKFNKNKWWLTPEKWAEANNWMRGAGHLYALADYVEWTIEVGLRVEENLRLTRQHFMGLGTATPSLMVPGTKTAKAQATIPLSQRASAIAQQLLDNRMGTPSDKLFEMSYSSLSADWVQVRSFLGLGPKQGVELRALRRTHAAKLHANGMSTRNIQRLLRHETIETTEGYLHLTGSEEMEDLRTQLS